MILIEKKLLEDRMKKNHRKTNQKEFRIEKVIKMINYILTGKVMIIRLTAG